MQLNCHNHRDITLLVIDVTCNQRTRHRNVSTQHRLFNLNSGT
jgi:hypothetical protein